MLGVLAWRAVIGAPGCTFVRAVWINYPLKATNLQRVRTVAIQPNLCNATRSQSNRNYFPVILNALPIKPANHLLRGKHFNSRPRRDINTNVIGLRLG